MDFCARIKRLNDSFYFFIISGFHLKAFDVVE